VGLFKRKKKGGIESENWCVDYRDPNGKRIKKVIGPNKKDAEAYLGGIKKAIREGRFFDVKKENKTTFDELLDAYIEKVREKKFYKTFLRYFTPVLKKHFGGKLLSEITYKSLEDFRDERKKTLTQHGTPRSERTVNIEIAVLRRMFRKGVKWGMAEKNPFENADDLFYKNETKRERALTEDEVKRLIAACPRYLKPIVIMAVYTGLRKSDIFNLKWRDIDLKKGLIRLEEAKTGKTRNIVLNSDMITLLQSLPVKCQYAFPNKHGKPFKDVKRSFEMALRKAGIEQSEDRRYKIVFHSLRHTCISILHERGADRVAVQNYVAHASEEMTARYTHLSQEYARKTAEILKGLCDVGQIDGNILGTSASFEDFKKFPPIATA
jgi:integrase